MSRNNYKDSHVNTPIEQHDTAAWANINKQKAVSKVLIPSDAQVANSKEHVDTNQK